MAIGSRFPQVLQAAIDGMEWAWSELYREYAPPLLRFLRNQGARDAEDLLGECFVQILRHLSDFSGDEEGFRAWTFTIARSRLADHWRSNGRRPVILVDDPAEVDAPGPTPGAEIDQDLISQAEVARILGGLTPEQRAVVTLRFLDHFSVAETAVILGRSEGAIKLLQHRAVRALRKSLGSSAVRRPGVEP